MDVQAKFEKRDKARTHHPAIILKVVGWVLEHKQSLFLSSARRPDPLMGWSSVRESSDERLGVGAQALTLLESASETTNQIKLTFETKEEAIAYAERHSLEYTVQIPREVKPKLKAYADNFSYSRNGSWTH